MKQIMPTVIKILISIFLLWFLVHSSKLNFGLLPTMLYSPVMLGCTLSIYLIGIVITAWRWRKLNNVQNIHLTYYQTLLPTYLGIAFNNLLPGGVGGDFFRFYFINKKTPASKSAVMLSILLDRISGLSGIFIIVCALTLFHANNFLSHKLTFYFVLLCLLICIIGIVLYFISTLLPQTVGLSAWLKHKFENKKWLNSALTFLEAVRIYRNSKKMIIECLIASVMIQVLIAITCMFIANMMHFPTISFYDYVMAIGVTQLVNLIPIAPGGFGMGEMAFANVLLLLNPGTSATYATIFLAYRLLGILVYLPGIAVFIFDKNLLSQRYNFKEEIIA